MSSIQLVQTSSVLWDMQSSSMPHFPCFRFISDRLARCKLYIILILSPNEPFFIPVWPISRAAESKIIRICRRACELFPTTPSWVAQIASRSASRYAVDRLEARPSDTYLIRRSLVQHETIFSGEGLTLLSADHIHTLKQYLCMLSHSRSIGTEYMNRMDSCVQLLRRINNTYRGVKLSKSYLERAYDLDLCHSTLREVCKTYSRQFGEIGVREVSLETRLEAPQLPELESPTDGQPTYPLPELESPTSQNLPDVPPALGCRTTAAEMACPSDDETPYSDVLDFDMGSPSDYLNIGVTYPKVPTPASAPKTSPFLSSQPSLDTITTTICSRCLATVQPQASYCGQEMTMLMGSEWEDFRRIGLGILRC